MKHHRKLTSALIGSSLLAAGLLSGCSQDMSGGGSGVSDGSGGTEQDGALSDITVLSDTDEAAIRAVIYDQYLGGQKRSDVEAIRASLHPDSVMMIPQKDDQGRSVLTITDDMHSEVEQWANPGLPDLDIAKFPILSITAADNRIAQVILKAEDRVYDAITLTKIDGEWIIASKVYILQQE